MRGKRIFLQFLTLFWLLLMPGLALGDSRTWTSVDGRTIEAELIKVEGDTVTIRRIEDWRLFDLPVSRLSEADQDYLEGLEGDSKEENTPGSPQGSSFPEDGLEWEDKVSAPGDFDVDILKEDNDAEVYRYRAGHFVFESDTKLARKVVADFAEVFEATYEAVKAMPLRWNIVAPTEGYAVRLYGDYDDYVLAGGTPGSGGVYNSGSRQILVPLRSLGVKKSSSGVTLDGDGETSILIHEVTHQMHHDWLHRLPVWLVEGFAEFMEAVPYERGTFRFNKLEPSTALRYRPNEFMMTDLETLMTMSFRAWSETFQGESTEVFQQYISAFLLTYYFVFLDGDGEGRRLWDALRIMEKANAIEKKAAMEEARQVLLAGRSYEELFDDLQRAYRSEGIKLVER